MSQDKVRWFAQRGLVELDWLDQHVMPRRAIEGDELERHIDELRRVLLRLAGAACDEEAYSTAPEDPMQDGLD